MSNTITDDPVELAGLALDQAIISGDDELIEAASKAYDIACETRAANSKKNLARANRLSTAICDVPGFVRVVIGQGNILTVLVSRSEASKRLPEEFEGYPVIAKLAD